MECFPSHFRRFLTIFFHNRLIEKNTFRTDGWTNILSFRDTCTHLKKPIPRVVQARFRRLSNCHRYLQVEFTRAVEDFDEAIKLNPNVANFFYNRGLIKFRLKVRPRSEHLETELERILEESQMLDLWFSSLSSSLA